MITCRELEEFITDYLDGTIPVGSESCSDSISPSVVNAAIISPRTSRPSHSAKRFFSIRTRRCRSRSPKISFVPSSLRDSAQRTECAPPSLTGGCVRRMITCGVVGAYQSPPDAAGS